MPASASKILDVGCAEGRLGEALRAIVPGRQVYGIEREPAAAARAAARLDRVFALDIEHAVPDLAPGSLDVILFGDILEHLVDPVTVLCRCARLLRPDGRLICCIPNVQHHSVLTSLVRGDFQYQDAGLLDATHLRFFTWASFTKILLDAGLTPRICESIRVTIPNDVLQAFWPLFAHLKVDPKRGAADLSTYQWIFEGTLLGWDASPPEELVSIVACVNDEAQLAENLAASPCFRSSVPHELITVRGARSAAHGFDAGIARARHPIVALVHQDVYLPAGWPARFLRQWRLAEKCFGTIGVAGVYGTCFDPTAPDQIARAGHVVDRQVLRREPPTLPAQVETLDELLLAVPKDTRFRLDPSLGFHFYGADLALQARKAGHAAVALDAPCFHNSLTEVEVSSAFDKSLRVFRAKWASDLPIATSCTVVRPRR